MSQKQYTGHRMRRNHSNALPRYIVSYATEIKNVRDSDNPTASSDVFVRGALISCRMVNLQPTNIRPRIINSPTEFWQQMSELSAVNYTTWVVGHSVLYEMLVSGMPEQFEEAKFVVDWPRSKRKREANNDDDPHSSALVIINNPPTIVACRCVATGGRIVIVDLLNWFASSIDDIAETVSADKEDWRYAIEGFAELDTPSMRKAGVVMSAFLRLASWSRANDMGMFRYTAASQAMSAYRHRFMTHDILVHDNADVKKLEREAYFGGRTELYRVGAFHHRVHQLDVSSLFPSVMQNGKFPVKLEQFVQTTRWSANLPPIRWDDSVAKVWLRTTRPDYPVRLPQGVVYPIGEFKTVLCGDELSLAFARGEIVSVQSWAEYQTEPIFTSWVDYMWALRQQHETDGDAIYAKLVKLMLNGLYGKFGQKSSVWINLDSYPSRGPWQQWTEKNCLTEVTREFRSFGHQLQEFKGHGELGNTFVAISAFVSAAARMRMNQLREIAGRHDVYYQGVDGLIVTERGRKRLDDAKQIREATLGYLRHQLTVDEGELLGYCDYRLGSKVVKSGLAGNAVLTLDAELLQQISLVSDSLFDRGGKTGVSKIDTLWRRDAMTAKGVVDDNGTVWPFVFHNAMPAESDSLVSVT